MVKYKQNMSTFFQRVRETLEWKLGKSFSKYEETRESYLSLLRDARKWIYIVAGELDPSFYSGEFVEIIEKKLKSNEGIIINILYHKKPAKDIKEAMEYLKRENPSFFNLLNQIKNTPLEKRINIYWAERRPKYHFVVADNNVFIEKQHKPKEPRESYLKRNTVKLYRWYIDDFDILIKSPVAHRIEIRDL